MDTKAEIHFIDEDNFEAVVIREQRPVLLLCMPRDQQFDGQIKVLTETAARYAGRLKVGLLDEGFIGPFKKKYRVLGTPTFLVLQEGREKNRLLGLADEPMLEGLIREACCAPRGFL